MTSGQTPSKNQHTVVAGDSAPRAARMPFWRWTLRILLVLGAAVVAYVWYAGTHLDLRTYGAGELANGPVTQIIRWDEGHTAVQTSRLTDLPADQLWKVV